MPEYEREDDITLFLQILMGEGDVIEVRGIGDARISSGYYRIAHKR